MFSTKRLVFGGLCIALSVVLPYAFHTIPDAGMVFLPMHIPVLLCGLACGWPYGLACGILAPILNTLITGMPPLFILPGIICELAVYGLVAGLMVKAVHTKKPIIGIYIDLIVAMLAGRVVMGLVNAFIFPMAQYSFSVWVGAAFITALPGIIIQLALIPIIIFALEKAKLIEYARA